MTDIEERLRKRLGDRPQINALCDEATDEIERLTAQIAAEVILSDSMRREIERLTAERDELFLENGKLANELGAECLRLRAALRRVHRAVANDALKSDIGDIAQRALARAALEGK